MQPEGVSRLHSSGVSLHGSRRGASSRDCSSSSAVGGAAAFMYGDPAGSRSDARASSLICAGAAASAACSAALAAAALSARACSAAAFFAAGPLVSGVSMRSREQRPLLAVRQAGAGAGLARPMATGDSVSEAPMAGNPKANDNIQPSVMAVPSAAPSWLMTKARNASTRCRHPARVTGDFTNRQTV